MASIDKDGGVKGGFDVIESSGQCDAGKDGGRQITRGGVEVFNRGAAASEEAGFFNEVGGRIAADGEFGENGEPRA